MTKKATLMCTAVLLALCAGSLWLYAAEASATRVVACTAVKDREPVGPASQFPAAAGEVWCFSEIRGAEGSVTHVWYHGDREVGRMSLAVKGDRWRTWSHKTVPAAWTGPWHVSVLDAQGKEIGSVAFEVVAK